VYMKSSAHSRQQPNQEYNSATNILALLRTERNCLGTPAYVECELRKRSKEAVFEMPA